MSFFLLPDKSMPTLRLSRIQSMLHIDPWLLLGLIILMTIGTIILFSASGESIEQMERQALRIGLAMLIMLTTAQISPRFLKFWTPWIFFAMLALLIAVLIIGEVGKGAQRWLQIGFISFQPSELMKLAMPMMLAWYLAHRSVPPNFTTLIGSLFIIMIATLLIAKQPDLGTALLIASGGMAMLFLSGISWRIVSFAGIATSLCLPILWFFMHDYQKQRVISFLNPEHDPLGAGYHIIQSKIAIGSGGIWGKGWLNGTQSQLEFLPERSTDFIFAVYGEEFGLIGTLILICLYLLIIGRGLFIAIHAQDTYCRLLASGLTIMFFGYVIINIGMVIGLLPVVGVPLPLISYGGSSMLTLMIGFGLLMSIHTHRKFVSS